MEEKTYNIFDIFTHDHHYVYIFRMNNSINLYLFLFYEISFVKGQTFHSEIFSKVVISCIVYKCSRVVDIHIAN